MASIDELKKRINPRLHDLAARLGIKQGKGGEDALYHSPHHKDSTPSLSIFVNDPKHGTGWKDWSSDEGGSCIDLVMYVLGLGVSDAMKWLHDAYAIPYDTPDKKDQPQQKSMVDYIADRCTGAAAKAREYLAGRGIGAPAIDAAIKARTIGFNEWTSPSKQPGSVGYGGAGVAFIVRDPSSSLVVAVDVRYVDPALNGDVKTQTHGEKEAHYWTADPRKLDRARRVVLLESSINALSVDTCDLPGTAALSIRGTGNASLIDLTFLRGKQVVICMDNDEPIAPGRPKAGTRPGAEAAWILYERCTALNISAVLVDQSEWLYSETAGKEKAGKPINDANDYLQANGVDELAEAIENYETWLIAGMSGEAGPNRGKPRVYLPAHDYAQYWRFRSRLDFTSHITRMDRNSESGAETPQYSDLCGFRVASLSRVSVASSTSTMTGDPDHSPTVYFSVTVQTPRHGARLTRKVLQDDQLHNATQWSKFGPIWKPAEFSRMVNILERTADLGARSAANFVGLAWRDGQLAVNEGPDCYFTEAEKQCTYHNLTFPSGPASNARKIIKAYQETFKSNAAAIALTWALGGHLKALLGFWPHMTLQADKGAGKSTLIKRLERTLAFTMFSGQSLQTEFRLLTSISYTSHPVGWEELSARRQDVIDKAVAILQESYQYSTTKRGAEMTEYLMCAPVMLAGEDVPVRSLLGKLVRTTLTGKKGPMMPDDLPQFPVRQWLQFLTRLDKMDVLAKYAELQAYCLKQSRASGDDDGAKRMAGNYAAVLLAWRYLAEFAGVDPTEGNFGADLLAEMNTHVAESSSDRSPWVWIMETALSEIDAGNFKHPYKFENINGKEYLLLRPGHIMDHLSSAPSLREKWNALPVKTGTVFKRQLAQAGILPLEDGAEIERTIFTRRVRHLSALSLEDMHKFGLSVAWRND